MGQRANLTILRKDGEGAVHYLAVGYWGWGGYTYDALSQLSDAADEFSKALAEVRAANAEVDMAALAGSVFERMGGTWHGEKDADGNAAMMSEPIYWFGEEDVQDAPNDVVTEVEMDVTDPDNPGFWVGGSFIQTTLGDEMDDCGCDLEELLETGKLIVVYEPTRAMALMNALNGERLHRFGLDTMLRLINEHPYDGGGLYALPGFREDTDLLCIIGD